MRAAEVQPGFVYHDGKQGLREVTEVNLQRDIVRYRILAAKVESMVVGPGEREGVVGGESQMAVRSFASWAKVRYEREQAKGMVLRMKAARVKLTPMAFNFMSRLFERAGGRRLKADERIAFESGEARTVEILESKGLLRKVGDFEAVITELGVARLEML